MCRQPGIMAPCCLPRPARPRTSGQSPGDHISRSCGPANWRSTRRPGSRGFHPRCGTRAVRSKLRRPADCRAWSNARDIRGDLHMHSTYSDGQDTLETMVAAAARARLRIRRDHRPLDASRGLAHGVARSSRPAARRDRAAARAVPGDRDPARHRGRHPAGRPPRLRRRGPEHARHRPGVASRSARGRTARP